MLYAATLLNLPVTNHVGNDLVAVIPWDSHETSEQRKIDGFDAFMSGFTDAFGRAVRPSVIVLNNLEIRPEQWFPSISAFRNVLAISSIPTAWARAISANRQLEGLYFGDYFHIYPYEIAVQGTIAAFDPATRGMGKLSEARGQTLPGLHTFSELGDFWDAELFSALLARWADRFAIHPLDQSWSSGALFRSLEMAFRASLMPFTNQGSLDDYGAQVGLWV